MVYYMDKTKLKNLYDQCKEVLVKQKTTTIDSIELKELEFDSLRTDLKSNDKRLTERIIDCFITLVRINCRDDTLLFLSSTDLECLRQVYKKEELERQRIMYADKQYVLMPFNDDYHWVLLYINLLEKQVLVFDSNGTGLKSNHAVYLQRYLKSVAQVIGTFNVINESTYRQCIGSDCSLIVCLTILRISITDDPIFVQKPKWTRNFSNKMREIMLCQLITGDIWLKQGSRQNKLKPE